MPTFRRPRWPRSARQAKGHAILVAVILWIVAGVVSFTGTSDRGIAGPLKGADFVQFYTLGHLASAHRIAAMYDAALFHQAQAELLPESAREIYPPVYPPQAAVLFAPMAGLSYQRALFIWSVITIAGYALIRVERVESGRRSSSRSNVHDRRGRGLSPVLEPDPPRSSHGDPARRVLGRMARARAPSSLAGRLRVWTACNQAAVRHSARRRRARVR